MDINKLISSINENLSEFMASYCIVNGAIMNLEEIQNMGCREFGLRAKTNMPIKLYKYFPNLSIDQNGKKVNYSLQALENNTVFMQTPSEFDDVYDSDISLDFYEYEYLRLIEYCRRCQISISSTLTTQEIGDAFIGELLQSFKSTKDFYAAFKKQPTSEIEKLSNEHFVLRLNLELNNCGLGEALTKIIRQDFEDYSLKLKNTFRTSCFATTPYSQLMWGGAYANCHKGFCAEYTILPNQECYSEIYYNLFPMIYCKLRPNMTRRLVSMQDTKITEEGLWDIYFHGALRKSIDWAFQNEWRLLLPMRCKNVSDYNIKFYPITKVFIGNRMDIEDRRKIIDICKKRNIPYIGVTRNPNIFEMQDCAVKCEDCIKFNNNPNT